MATATRGARRDIVFDASGETAPAKTSDPGPGRHHPVRQGAISSRRCNHWFARTLTPVILKSGGNRAGDEVSADPDDVAARMASYGWNVERVGDGNDQERVQAVAAFKATADAPTSIVVDGHIGYGAPDKQELGAAYGELRGEREVGLAKPRYGWPDGECHVPSGSEHAAAGVGGRALRSSRLGLFDAYRGRYGDPAGDGM